MATSDSGFIFSLGDILTTPNKKNPTPSKISTIQNLDLSITSDIVELFGNRRFSESAAPTTLSMSGTITTGEVSPSFISQYVLGGTETQGYLQQKSVDVKLTDNAGDVEYIATGLKEDLGVLTLLGVRFTRIYTGTPNEGQYIVDLDTGTYTFNAADADTFVNIRYSVQNTTEGRTFTVGNPLMGSNLTFRLEFVAQYAGKGVGVILPRCVCTSSSLGFVNNDYVKPTFDFTAFYDKASGTSIIIQDFDYTID